MTKISASSFGLLGLCALTLTACSTGTTTTTTTTTTTPVDSTVSTGPTTPAAGAAAVANGSYTLQSVTVPSFDSYQKDRVVIACPGKNATEKVDCTNNAASFVDGKYDLGVIIDTPMRTGTYAAYTAANNPSLNIQLNGNLVGNWTVVGSQYTLTVTGLVGNYSGGSLRFPTKFIYTKN
ncbi:hypothetical protein [Deinococcus sp.]|uniref:hypothetical protein n=1 Tax=Deinococcus sp. TaxID=47478 RepID=UPI0025D37953|nr:hypothetical protein [Deinococcus sp.]